MKLTGRLTNVLIASLIASSPCGAFSLPDSMSSLVDEVVDTVTGKETSPSKSSPPPATKPSNSQENINKQNDSSNYANDQKEEMSAEMYTLRGVILGASISELNTSDFLDSFDAYDKSKYKRRDKCIKGYELLSKLTEADKQYFDQFKERSGILAVQGIDDDARQLLVSSFNKNVLPARYIHLLNDAVACSYTKLQLFFKKTSDNYLDFAYIAPNARGEFVVESLVRVFSKKVPKDTIRTIVLKKYPSADLNLKNNEFTTRKTVGMWRKDPHLFITSQSSVAYIYQSKNAKDIKYNSEECKAYESQNDISLKDF